MSCAGGPAMEHVAPSVCLEIGYVSIAVGGGVCDGPLRPNRINWCFAESDCNHVCIKR